MNVIDMRRTRMRRVPSYTRKGRLGGLTKDGIKTWAELESLVNVSDVFGRRDLQLRMFLENRMSPSQRSILSGYFESLDNIEASGRTDEQVRSAIQREISTTEKRLLKTLK